MAKDDPAVLEQALHSFTLGLHVGHVTFRRPRSHDGWGEHDGKIVGCHLCLELAAKMYQEGGVDTYEILFAMRHDPHQMEDQELQRIPVGSGHVVDPFCHLPNLLALQVGTFHLSSIQHAFIAFVSDQRIRQLPQIMLQGTSDGVDVKVRVREVKASTVLFESQKYGLDLGLRSRFAIDAFLILATCLNFFDTSGDNGWNNPPLVVTAS